MCITYVHLPARASYFWLTLSPPLPVTLHVFQPIPCLLLQEGVWRCSCCLKPPKPYFVTLRKAYTGSVTRMPAAHGIGHLHAGTITDESVNLTPSKSILYIDHLPRYELQ
jgi:hypothetical protein